MQNRLKNQNTSQKEKELATTSTFTYDHQPPNINLGQFDLQQSYQQNQDYSQLMQGAQTSTNINQTQEMLQYLNYQMQLLQNYQQIYNQNLQTNPFAQSIQSFQGANLVEPNFNQQQLGTFQLTNQPNMIIGQQMPPLISQNQNVVETQFTQSPFAQLKSPIQQQQKKQMDLQDQQFQKQLATKPYTQQQQPGIAKQAVELPSFYKNEQKNFDPLEENQLLYEKWQQSLQDSHQQVEDKNFISNMLKQQQNEKLKSSQEFQGFQEHENEQPSVEKEISFQKRQKSEQKEIPINQTKEQVPSNQQELNEVRPKSKIDEIPVKGTNKNFEQLLEEQLRSQQQNQEYAGDQKPAQKHDFLKRKTQNIPTPEKSENAKEKVYNQKNYSNKRNEASQEKIQFNSVENAFLSETEDPYISKQQSQDKDYSKEKPPQQKFSFLKRGQGKNAFKKQSEQVINDKGKKITRANSQKNVSLNSNDEVDQYQSKKKKDFYQDKSYEEEEDSGENLSTSPQQKGFSYQIQFDQQNQKTSIKGGSQNKQVKKEQVKSHNDEPWGDLEEEYQYMPESNIAKNKKPISDIGKNVFQEKPNPIQNQSQKKQIEAKKQIEVKKQTEAKENVRESNKLKSHVESKIEELDQEIIKLKKENENYRQNRKQLEEQQRQLEKEKQQFEI